MCLGEGYPAMEPQTTSVQSGVKSQILGKAAASCHRHAAAIAFRQAQSMLETTGVPYDHT